MEDKPRTDLGQAEDKKGLAKGSHRGKVQYYQNLPISTNPDDDIDI